MFSQVFGAICKQVFSRDSVVAFCASELSKQGRVKLFHFDLTYSDGLVLFVHLPCAQAASY